MKTVSSKESLNLEQLVMLLALMFHAEIAHITRGLEYPESSGFLAGLPCLQRVSMTPTYRLFIDTKHVACKRESDSIIRNDRKLSTSETPVRVFHAPSAQIQQGQRAQH